MNPHPCLQLFSGDNRFIVPASFEILSSGIVGIYPEDLKLCLLSDDFEKDIHSINIVPYTNTNTNEYTVDNAGAKISGIITYYGEPYSKPVVILYNSSKVILGICEGGLGGEYFFKNIPASDDYILEATIYG